MKGKTSFSFRTYNLFPSFKELVCYIVFLSSVIDRVWNHLFPGLNKHMFQYFLSLC